MLHVFLRSLRIYGLRNVATSPKVEVNVDESISRATEL
jgi:hypothetical protein